MMTKPLAFRAADSLEHYERMIALSEEMKAINAQLREVWATWKLGAGAPPPRGFITRERKLASAALRTFKAFYKAKRAWQRSLDANA